MMSALPNFRTRQAELREKLLWTPPPSPRRRVIQEQLLALVRAELQAETAAAERKAPQIATEAPPAPDRVASDVPPGPRSAAGDDPYGGQTPWWIEQ